MRHADDTAMFADAFFQVIFSEETLEHVASLDRVAQEMFRLTSAGGVGVHSYPDSKMFFEPHLRMPLIHWFSPGQVRRILVVLLLVLGFGPNPASPETAGVGIWKRAGIYADYLRRKTYFRDVSMS